MVSVLAAQRVRAIKTEGGRKNLENQYAIEMLNITKKFPGIIAPSVGFLGMTCACTASFSAA